MRPPLDTNSLGAPQSGGMNEGWSDYVACTINNVVVLGNWVLNNTTGIRGFPYDSNFPDHFGKLGTGRYSAGPSGQANDPHNVGEIWCATLMEMNRRTDRHVAVQLVIDALKLWRWCHKCQSLYFAGNPTQGVCKAGGTHDHTGSGDYKLIFNAWGSPAQHNWRWCHKCQGLYFTGNPTQGVCPSGGSHDHTGSGDYSLMSH
jgi:hypothetical protein